MILKNCFRIYSSKLHWIHKHIFTRKMFNVKYFPNEFRYFNSNNDQNCQHQVWFPTYDYRSFIVCVFIRSNVVTIRKPHLVLYLTLVYSSTVLIQIDGSYFRKSTERSLRLEMLRLNWSTVQWVATLLSATWLLLCRLQTQAMMLWYTASSTYYMEHIAHLCLVICEHGPSLSSFVLHCRHLCW